jgi:hypothetical protein
MIFSSLCRDTVEAIVRDAVARKRVAVELAS